MLWRDESLDRIFRNIYAEIGIRRIILCKIKAKWQKIGI
jgi:hypothetical protein